jgi:hypothetical protein
MMFMNTSALPRRWYIPTPAWLVYGAATATAILFASERWRWFWFNEHKGYTVLLAVAVVCAVLILLAAWMLLALLFRRRAQFGLRTLIVFVTLCALVCSWLGVRMKQARRQAEIAAMIKQKLHGEANYFWQFDTSFPPRPILVLLGP